MREVAGNRSAALGDGWILLADTKKSLLLIQRPEG